MSRPHPASARRPLAVALLALTLPFVAAVGSAGAAGSDPAPVVSGRAYVQGADPAPVLSGCPAGSTVRGLRVTSTSRDYSPLATAIAPLCADAAGRLSDPPVSSEPAVVTEDLPCPTGSALTGIHGNVGVVVDRVGPVCTAPGGQPTYGPMSTTTGGDTLVAALCPAPARVATTTVTHLAFADVDAITSVSLGCRVPTILAKLTGGTVQVGPRARLTTTTGAPVVGRKVRFTSARLGAACTATTDARGVAACPLTIALGPVRATFAGDDTYEPASASS